MSFAAKNEPILITGARGFIGKNLTAELRNRGYENLLLFDLDTDPARLADYAASAKFVFHLAGINRPKDPKEFYEGNRGFTEQLLHLLEKAGNRCPVLATSSIQAALDNDYGKSKKEAESLLFAYGQKNGAPLFVFRLQGVFGKWCRPGYNSVVATFCHNAANGLPLEVRDPDYVLPLIYIDDVVAAFLACLAEDTPAPAAESFCSVTPVHTVTLGWLADTVQGFAAHRTDLGVPDMADAMTSNLYSTWLSYLPADGCAYDLVMHADARGSFTEFLRTQNAGQVSVNISHPGIVKGNHWHHSKNEKFLVVKGTGVIRLRKIDETQVHEYRVDGSRLQVVDIPTGYTHNIENLGTEDMVTVMWANEPFDPAHPDTFALPV